MEKVLEFLNKVLYEYYYLIPIAILLFILLILIFRFAKSERKNRSVNKYGVTDRNLNNYSMRIDFNNEMITLYKKGNYKGIEIPTDVFLRFIAPEDQKKYKEWIDKIRTKRLDDKEFLYITISNIENETSTEYYRLKNYDYSKNNAFCSMTKLNKQVHDEEIEIKTFEDFRQNYNQEKSRPRVIYCVNFGLYNTILNRYGTVAAKNYVEKLYTLLQTYKNKNTTVVSYKDDSFLIILSKMLNIRRLGISSRKIINEFTRTLFFFNLQVEIMPTVGCASSISNFQTINEFAEAAYSASNNTENERYRFYDDKMIKAKRKNVEDSEELRELMNSFYDCTTMSSVISLLDGSPVGVFPEVKFKDDKYVTYNDGFELAKGIDKTATYFYTSVSQWFKKYHDEECQNKLFMFLDIDKIDFLTDVLMNNEHYQAIDIVAIITEYDPLIENPEVIKKLSNLTKDFNITLGILASDKMITSLSNHLHHFNWIIIPNKMSSVIVEDNKGKFKINMILNAVERFNLNVLAWHVSEFAIAEALKKLGVDFLQGPILDNDSDDIISKRQLAKLIDESEDK